MTPLVAESDVAVVGGGVMAGAVALELARAGRRPLLVPIPHAPEIGHAATGPAMAYAEAARRIGREAAREVWEVFRESHERLRAFLAAISDDCGYRQRGAFLLAVARAEGALLADSEDMLREDAFPGEFLDHYMLETRFPVTGFSGAYWANDDAELDAGRLAAALRAGALERGATVASVGALREISAGEGGVDARGEEGRVRARQAVLAQDALVHVADLAIPTRRIEQVEADITPRAALPSPARTTDGRFRWQARGGSLRLHASAEPMEVDALLGRLPAHAAVRQEAVGLATEDRMPLVGPLAGANLALACGPEPVGLAFSAARWIAEWVRTGRDPTPAAFCAARP